VRERRRREQQNQRNEAFVWRSHSDPKDTPVSLFSAE
jgi:hypothetical protein